MNILQINQFDTYGGAAIAAYRLHEGLLAKSLSSQLFVGMVTANQTRVQAIPRQRYLEKPARMSLKLLGFTNFHLINTFNIPQHELYKNADIVNFHNLHGGYFNYLAIPQLTARKPTVWTLHDMWSFTGHCAYSYDCDRWLQGCGKCPYLDVHPSIQRDSTKWEWKLKNWVYSRSNLTIVTPSKWLFEIVKQSMLHRFPIHHIPNGIDINIYQPLDLEQSKALLGLPKGKKVLMFGAHILNDVRKGGDLLFKALASLPASLKAETLLLTMGSSNGELAEAVGMQTINLGYIDSDRLKSIAYSAADLFIFPTRADNLPLVLQESMACGTPMVSFNVGGVPDLVRPNITGYLAKPEDPEDFANGIVQLLEDNDLRDRLSQNCRAIALSEYSLELQAQRYIELYHQLLH